MLNTEKVIVVVAATHMNDTLLFIKAVAESIFHSLPPLIRQL